MLWNVSIDAVYPLFSFFGGFGDFLDNSYSRGVSIFFRSPLLSFLKNYHYVIKKNNDMSRI